MQFSRGDAVVVIDVDLQDPPELIIEMVAKWREGWDVVMAQRRSRAGETWIKRLVSFVGYQIINRIERRFKDGFPIARLEHDLSVIPGFDPAVRSE